MGSFLARKKSKRRYTFISISIAAGLYSATNNLKEESIYAVSDNIARKLLKKLPDLNFNRLMKV